MTGSTRKRRETIFSGWTGIFQKDTQHTQTDTQEVWMSQLVKHPDLKGQKNCLQMVWQRCGLTSTKRLLEKKYNSPSIIVTWKNNMTKKLTGYSPIQRVWLTGWLHTHTPWGRTEMLLCSRAAAVEKRLPKSFPQESVFFLGYRTNSWIWLQRWYGMKERRDTWRRVTWKHTLPHVKQVANGGLLKDSWTQMRAR